MTITKADREKAKEAFENLDPKSQDKHRATARRLFPEETIDRLPNETKAAHYLREVKAQEDREAAIEARAIELYHKSLQPTPVDILKRKLTESFERDAAKAKEDRAAAPEAEELERRSEEIKEKARKRQRDNLHNVPDWMR